MGRKRSRNDQSLRVQAGEGGQQWRSTLALAAATFAAAPLRDIRIESRPELVKSRVPAADLPGKKTVGKKTPGEPGHTRDTRTHKKDSRYPVVFQLSIAYRESIHRGLKSAGSTLKVLGFVVLSPSGVRKISRDRYE